MDLKFFFFKTLFSWMSILGGHFICSVCNLMDLCNLCV